MTLPFLRRGYEYHIDEGDIRAGRNNPIEPKLDDAGVRWVRVCTSNGDRILVPTAALIAMHTSEPQPNDDTDNIEEDAKAARFRDCGVSYQRCHRCCEPIPHTVMQVGPIPTPTYLFWDRNITAELKHELRCTANLMRQPPRHDVRVRVIH